MTVKRVHQGAKGKGLVMSFKKHRITGLVNVVSLVVVFACTNDVEEVDEDKIEDETPILVTVRPPAAKPDECCMDPGAISVCWWQDAERDGVSCHEDTDCPNNTSCIHDGLGGLESPNGSGLCECDSNDDCGDDGVCSIADGDTVGVCGPSFCNGYRICSCFGGCVDAEAGDYDTPEEQCANTPGAGYCCDGVYPDIPGTNLKGYCSDSGSCGEGGCTQNSDCPDDGNPCTDEWCDTATGGCEAGYNTDPCDDLEPCTEADMCNLGVCEGTDVICPDDSNICTDDDCVLGDGCTYPPDPVWEGQPCDDNDECTIGDVCDLGTCESGEDWTVNDTCGVGDVCKQPICDAVTGCGWDTATYDGDTCDDNNACTDPDECSAGACVPGAAVNCDDTDICTTDSCDTTDTDGNPCNYVDVVDCCDEDADCTTECDGLGLVDECVQGECDETTGDCFCNQSWGFDQGLTCTIAADSLEYPDNCYEDDGMCTALGECVPPEILLAENNTCAAVFNGVDLDSSSVGYLGSFANDTDPVDQILEVAGSNICAENTYQSMGNNCVESTGARLGSSGKDVVYSFEYATNGVNQYQLYSFVVKVEADFDVAVYTMNDVQQESDCPGAVVPSARCFDSHLGSARVNEDQCVDGNDIRNQECCDPSTNECDGTSGTTGVDGYYWCTRYYPAGCCLYEQGEDCSDPPCGGRWDVPPDPYNCAIEQTGYTYTHVATAVISPLGDTDGSMREALIYIDGIGGDEGNFYVTVERRKWFPGIADRANDNARVYDVTNSGYADTSTGDVGATYLGNLDTAVNSNHAANGLCGTYSCANEFVGGSECHQTNDALSNEFWPNNEWFKIDRPPGSGSQVYCFQTDETGMADLTLVAKEMDDFSSIVAGSSTDYGCVRDFQESDNILNSYLPHDGNIKVELTADEGQTYVVGISNYEERTGPCGTVGGDECDYELMVTEGECWGYDCDFTEDFEDYNYLDEATVPMIDMTTDTSSYQLHGKGVDSDSSCGWAGPWRSWNDNKDPAHTHTKTVLVYDSPDVVPFKGALMRQAYEHRGSRRFRVPNDPTHIYFSVRLLDLCNVTDPGDFSDQAMGHFWNGHAGIYTGFGDCRTWGKSMLVSLCGEAVQSFGWAGGFGDGSTITTHDKCLTLEYTTAYNRAGINVYSVGEGRIQFRDAANHITASTFDLSRPMHDPFGFTNPAGTSGSWPNGIYATVLVTETEAYVWMDHDLASGLPDVADADLYASSISLGSYAGLEDFNFFQIRKVGSWGEAGALFDDINIRVVQDVPPTGGPPPAACPDVSTWYGGNVVGTIDLNAGVATPNTFSGNTCDEINNLGGVRPGYDEAWQINVNSPSNAMFIETCTGGGYGATFDTEIGLFDCEGTLIEQDDADCPEDAWENAILHNNWNGIDLDTDKQPYYLIVDEWYGSGDCGDYTVGIHQ